MRLYFRSSDSAKNKTHCHPQTHTHTIAFVYHASGKNCFIFSLRFFQSEFVFSTDLFYIIKILMMTALRIVWIFITSDTHSPKWKSPSARLLSDSEISVRPKSENRFFFLRLSLYIYSNSMSVIVSFTESPLKNALFGLYLSAPMCDCNSARILTLGGLFQSNFRFGSFKWFDLKVICLNIIFNIEVIIIAWNDTEKKNF